MARRLLALGANMALGLLREGEKYGMAGTLVEIDPDRRRQAAERLGIDTYATVAEALAAHDDYAGAYIATPNDTHADLALALAPVGIPVFMEKPMATTPEACRQVLEAYRQSAGWLQIDFEYRFSPLYADAGAILHSGELGELRSIYAEYTVGSFLPTYGWRLDLDKAGGMFCEKLCHFVDLFRFWSRSEFAEIRVAAGPKGIDYYPDGSTDNLVAQFLTESGVFANLVHTHGSTALPRGAAGQDAAWADHGHRLGVYLNTTDGCIRIDVWPQTITLIRREPDDGMRPRIVRRIDYHHTDFMASHHDMAGMVRDFARRVHEGAGPRLDAEDSYKTMQAVFECDRQLYDASRAANARFT
jgi:predicted dehydrogenase